MPRYLTPGKLCLLVLIELYASDQVPADVRLDVLSFIASHLDASSGTGGTNDEQNTRISASDFTVFSETLPQWHSGIPGRTIYDLFLQRIWSLNNVHSLHVLFQQADGLVAPALPESPETASAKISRASPLGQFIRRSYVEFTKLQFDTSRGLWKSFHVYRASSHDVWASRNPGAVTTMESELPAWATKPSAHDDPDTALWFSTEDIDRILSISIHQLQKIGTRVPTEVKDRISEWLHGVGTHPMAMYGSLLYQFLELFDHWRAGQYTMALELLHMYFDYCITATDAFSMDKPRGAMNTYYQYAQLHLSVLHADFERWEESAAAMGECIATARENQDSACLNFALSYLLHLTQVHPQNAATSPFGNITKLIGGSGGAIDEEIAFLKLKAREGRHWSLLSSTLLEEARSEMDGRGTIHKAMECILQSKNLNVQHDLRTMMPAGKLFFGAALERLGQSSISNRLFETIDLVHGSDCPLADSVRATCRVAHNLATSGRYDDALQLLRAAKAGRTKGNLKLEQRLQTFIFLVLLRRSVHEEDLLLADYHLELLRPAQISGDAEVTFEITLLEIELLLWHREHVNALEVINKNIEKLKLKPSSGTAQILQLSLLKCHIFGMAGDPEKGLTIALRAARWAEKALVIPLMVEAVTALSLVLIEAFEFGAAAALLKGVVVWALEGHDTFLTARIFSHLAEANAGLAGLCVLDPVGRKRYMNVAEDYNERSNEAFTRVSDFYGMMNCLETKAMIASWKGDNFTAQQIRERYDQMMADKRAQCAEQGYGG